MYDLWFQISCFQQYLQLNVTFDFIWSWWPFRLFLDEQTWENEVNHLIIYMQENLVYLKCGRNDPYTWLDVTSRSMVTVILPYPWSIPDTRYITRPRGYKTFFMLNSAENEICSAYKKIKYHQFKRFSCKTELSMIIFLLINIKMPTIVGILIFISRKNFMLNWVEYEKSFITSGTGGLNPVSISLHQATQ